MMKIVIILNDLFPPFMVFLVNLCFIVKNSFSENFLRNWLHFLGQIFFVKNKNLNESNSPAFYFNIFLNRAKYQDFQKLVAYVVFLLDSYLIDLILIKMKLLPMDTDTIF